MMSALTAATMDAAVKQLCQRDPVLASVIARHGPPPFWVRPTGWQTLVRLILEQQVSLASGKAIYRRLSTTIVPFTAANLGTASIEQLQRCGLTRQKADYCRGLGRAVARGGLRLAAVARQDDGTARATLCRLKGIGPWTADCYLLMALRRPDIWPPGDLALVAAITDLFASPDEHDRASLIESWRPWRAVAARVLWHDYLGRRGRMSD